MRPETHEPFDHRRPRHPLLAGRFHNPLIGRRVRRAIGAVQVNPQQDLLAGQAHHPLRKNATAPS